MAVLDFAHLTWEEVRDLDRTKAVALLPVGAVEAHGPHLPLTTDVVIAETMARAAAVRLATRGYDALLLPPLAYTAAEFAAGFPGTVSLRPAAAPGRPAAGASGPRLLPPPPPPPAGSPAGSPGTVSPRPAPVPARLVAPARSWPRPGWGVVGVANATPRKPWRAKLRARS